MTVFSQVISLRVGLVPAVFRTQELFSCYSLWHKNGRFFCISLLEPAIDKHFKN